MRRKVDLCFYHGNNILRKHRLIFFYRNRIMEIIYILEKLKKLSIPMNSFEYSENFDEHEEVKMESTMMTGNAVNEDEFAKKYSTIKIRASENKNNSLIQGRKGHLIYLFPLLAECIGSKEPEIKDILREIFQEISKALGLELL